MTDSKGDREREKQRQGQEKGEKRGGKGLKPEAGGKSETELLRLHVPLCLLAALRPLEQPYFLANAKPATCPLSLLQKQGHLCQLHWPGP